jgi:hypothetical protein
MLSMGLPFYAFTVAMCLLPVALIMTCYAPKEIVDKAEGG